MPTPILFLLSRLRRMSAAALLLLCVVAVSQSLHAQDSPLHWQPLQAPAVPQAAGAIAGGGSVDPSFVCRAKAGGGVYPGQWIKGGCAITHDGQATLATDYEIASGGAMWGSFDPQARGILQTGNSADGTALYSCRAQYRGYQVGVITDNKCAFAFEGRYVAQRPPFEALYAAGAVPPPQPDQSRTPSAAAPPPKPQRHNQDDLGSLAPGADGPGGSCVREVGKAKANRMVKQCLQVSPATHPPCNTDNSCSLIRDEIRRGCQMLANRAPDFCPDYQ
jgi:hypothetical protein